MTSNSKIAEALAAFNRNELDRARTLAEAQIVDDQGPPEADHLLGLIDCRSGRMTEPLQAPSALARPHCKIRGKTDENHYDARSRRGACRARCLQ